MAVPGSEVVLLEGDDQREARRGCPGGPPGRCAALRQGRQALHRHRRADCPRAGPAARHLPGQAAADQPRRHDPRGQPVLQEGEGKVPRHLGARPAQPVHVRRAARAPAGSSSTTWATDRWEEVNEGFAGANYGWPAIRGRDDRPAVPRPDPFLPGRVGRRRGILPDRPREPASRPIPGKYFFMDFVQGWIKVLDPDHPHEGRALRRGPDPPVRPGVRARRQPVRAAARRLGHRRQVPAAHRLAAQDPPCFGRFPASPRRSLSFFVAPFACPAGLERWCAGAGLVLDVLGCRRVFLLRGIRADGRRSRGRR